MQGLWLENKQLSYRQAIPLPIPQANEALVKVRLAGICATDVELTQGYYPFSGILGHEFVGEIVSAAAQPQRVGEKVVGEINIHCGQCRECLRQRSTHCLGRRVLGIKNHHGAFADYLTLPLANLHTVPKSVSDEMAVFTEPLAAALHIQQQVTIAAQDKVLIMGAGRLGQLIAQTMRLTGCDLQVAARYPQQRELLAIYKISCVEESKLPSHEFDVVIEATGSAQGLSLALNAVRPCGAVVLKSTFAGNAQINLSPLVVNEVQLIGSRCGEFAPALQLLAQGLVNPSLLIAEVYSLAEGVKAMQQAANRGMMKVLLRPD
jgi:2-desacetyl-2-hydroxyethyl bacteriochlorophyllide A dehydrogenase